MKSHLVLMDVDTGVDDALAIMLALHSPVVRLAGFTTVDGNTTAEQAALNTRFLLRFLDLENQIPVIQGADETLERGVRPRAAEVHGQDGLGGVYSRFIEAGGRLAEGAAPTLDAADFILEQARRWGPELTLVATAPLTNLGLALRRAPADFRRIGQLLIMGGAVEVPGNINPLTEFNASCDPEAVAETLASGVPTVLFPLDVTKQVRLRASHLTADRRLPARKLEFIRDLTRHYMDFHAFHRGFHGAYVHDAMPVAYLLSPELFHLKEGVVVVDCSDGPGAGQTRWSRPGETGASISVAIGVDEAGFLDLFWRTLRGGSPS